MDYQSDYLRMKLLIIPDLLNGRENRFQQLSSEPKTHPIDPEQSIHSTGYVNTAIAAFVIIS